MGRCRSPESPTAARARREAGNGSNSVVQTQRFYVPWPDIAALGCDAKHGVRGAVTGVAVSAFDNFEEEALAIVRTVELEELAALIAIVEDVAVAQPCEEWGIEREAGVEVI